MTIELKPFDAAEYLTSDEAIAAYLESALEDGTPAEFTAALGVVARAKGMTEIAKKAGVSRPALYKSLSGEGKPEFVTVKRVLESLGLTLYVAPSQASPTGNTDMMSRPVAGEEVRKERGRRKQQESSKRS